jgi:hypothetical protein
MNRAPTLVRPAANGMQLGRRAVPTLPNSSVSGWRFGTQSSKRETGGLAGEFLSGLRSRPSGIWFGGSGSGAGSGNLPSAIRHRRSHRPISGGGWQPRVAGGGPVHSALHSVLHAVLNSALPCCLCPLSSIQPSTQSSLHIWWQVAAPGGRWRTCPFSPPFGPQRSPPSSIQSSVICHRFSHLRCPSPMQALPLYSILNTRYSQS